MHTTSTKHRIDNIYSDIYQYLITCKVNLREYKIQDSSTFVMITFEFVLSISYTSDIYCQLHNTS